MFRPLTSAALLGAAGVSAIALGDAVTMGLTGDNLVDENGGVNAFFVLVGLVHAFAYVAFAATLREQRALVDSGSRFRRVLRVVLTASLVVMAAGMGGGAIYGAVTGDVPDHSIYNAVGGTAFGLMFLGSIVLGLSLLRVHELRLAAWTLTGILGAFVLVIVLDAAGSRWAHPAYLEVLAAFGLAFIALAPPRTPAGAGARHTEAQLKAPNSLIE